MKNFSKWTKRISLMLAIVLTLSVANGLSINTANASEKNVQVYAAPEVESTTPEQEGGETTEVETTTEVVTTEPATEETTTKAPIKKITPAVVSGLAITMVKTNQIGLKWKSAKYATEYRVYRASEKSNGKMTNAKKIKTVKTTSFTDKGLKQGTKYKYYVYSYRVKKGEKTTHAKAANITALTVPTAVSKAKVAKVDSKAINLSWKKNKKASRYLVFRADETSKGKFSAFRMIAKVKKTKTAYADKKVGQGRVYKYKVLVQRTSGKLAVASTANVISGLTPLAAPKKLKKKSATKKTVLLTWKKVDRADYYEIRKDGKLVATTKKTLYKSKKLKVGVTYQFSVRAVRKYNKKKYSSSATSVDVKSKDFMKGTWVEVSIKKQTLYMYVKNKLYVKTPVVTGNVGDRHTSKGTHYVSQKSSPSRLRGSYGSQTWDVTVKYWLRFTGDGQGIHDSTWRSAYGGNIYKTDGSHGCVNTPLSAMKKIYKKAYIGMPVIVH